MKIRKLLNTLYVTTPESFLNRDGENIVISVFGEEKFRMPIHNLEGIVCFNYSGITPALMELCAKRSVGLSFINPFGKFLARVSGGTVGNVLLRKKQYNMTDNEVFARDVSINLIAGKIGNSRTVLLRGIRDHSEKIDVLFMKSAVNHLSDGLERLFKCKNPESVRGIEGDCAKTYFSALDQLILTQKEDFFMKSRSRKPPKDNFNALLSFFYTLLAHEVQNALESVGLDPYVGFLHRLRPGRASLALDLMEELRPYMVDRFVLSMINRKQVSGKDFLERKRRNYFIR